MTQAPVVDPPASASQVENLPLGRVKALYRPYILTPEQTQQDPWIESLELDTVTTMAAAFPRQPRLLVLYGSLRARSFSRLTAYEAARILDKLGADVRVFDPKGLPIKDEESAQAAKVQELRALTEWSDGHFWCSPEQHGTVTAVFKNQSEHASRIPVHILLMPRAIVKSIGSHCQQALCDQLKVAHSPFRKSMEARKASTLSMSCAS